ncbi:MAG: uroporphyrinogen decarboxylase family protein [Candidatus Ratteibacteria bacterium]|jgi:uroporphyrinogen decarboxylase
MTDREIIQRNLLCSDPERIGMNFSGGRMNDILEAGLVPSPVWREKRWKEGEFEYYDDEWGNIWYRVIGKGKGGEIFQPALSHWDKLDHLIFPDFDLLERYAHAKDLFAKNPDKYHLAYLPGFPFSICRYLRKMEIYFQDLLLEREKIDILHSKVADLLEKVIRNFAAAGADGITFCEDWGTQQQLLVSPSMWRDIFKPLFIRLCGTAHTCGLHVLMHSCGYNWEILGDLAEAGVNAFQFDQPALYDLTRLAGRLKELQVCLWAPVDIQRVLPTGDQSRIEKEAEEMVRLFGSPHGGLIAKDYGDLFGIGVEPEWDAWAYDSFFRSMRNIS